MGGSRSVAVCHRVVLRWGWQVFSSGPHRGRDLYSVYGVNGVNEGVSLDYVLLNFRFLSRWIDR